METLPIPTKPIVVGIETNSLTIEWTVDEASGKKAKITHYTVFYKAEEEDEHRWTKLETKDAVPEMKVTGLKPLKAYQFRVASNAGEQQSCKSCISDVIKTTKDGTSSTDKGRSQPSDHDLIKTLAEMTPPIPQKPFLQGKPCYNSLSLAWCVPGDTTHVTHYTISYREKEKLTWMVHETHNTDTSCTVNNLSPLTSYQFRVASNFRIGSSPSSEISDEIRTPEKPHQLNLDKTPPRPEKPIGHAANHDAVSLEWKVTGYTEHIIHYTITYKIAHEKSLRMVETASADTNFMIEELQPGTHYQFQVASNTERWQSPPSEMSDTIKTHEKSVTNPAQKHELPKPSSPTLVGIPNHNSVQLRWEVPETTRVIHYIISYCKADANNSTGTWTTVETKDARRSYTIEGLDMDTSYRFCVAFKTDEGVSQQSEASDVIRTEKDPQMIDPKPAKPRVDGTPGPNSIPLRWEVEGNTTHVTHYTISYCKTDAGSGVITVDTGDSACKYTIDGLQPETSYQFRVASNNNQVKGPPGEASDVITTKADPSREVLTPSNPDSSNQKPPKPSKPKVVVTPGQSSVQLYWRIPETSIHVNNYMITYRKTAPLGRWSAVETEGTDSNYTVEDLEEDTSYEFRVASNTERGHSLPSETSDVIHTSKFPQSARASNSLEVTHETQIAPEQHIPSMPRPPSKDDCPNVNARKTYRAELQKKSSLIKSDRGLPLYQVPLVKTKQVGAEGIQMLDLGVSPPLPKQEKVVLVVGATGAGKSTLINGLLNYVIGVGWEEKFRFRLVQETASFKTQHKSQTKNISIYTIHHHDAHNIPYTLKVIDTPGFGDTEGISKDKLITECIHNLFKNKDYGIDHIDAIGFVAQSSLARLTPTQRYIFESILSLFGKDISDNIFLLLTFSDSQMPPALASIREANIPFKTYFKFNNSALFAENDDSEDNELEEMFWNMGTKNFQAFLIELGNAEGKSLYMTKEVLEERQHLEVYVAGIQQDIQDGLTKLEQLKVEIGIVKQHKADIERNKHFTYTVEEHKMVSVPLEHSQNVTNCLTCNRTCHFPCKIENNDYKSSCTAMDSRGYCTVCPRNCIWKLHQNVPFRIEVSIVRATKTANELMKRYKRAKGEKFNAKKLTQQLLEDYHTLQIKVLFMITEVRRCLTRLAEIALRPNPLSTLDYLDMLIAAQRAEANPGFQARIDQLEYAKTEAKLLQQKSVGGDDPFDQYGHKFKSIHDTEFFESLAAKIRIKNPSILKNLYKKFV